MSHFRYSLNSSTIKPTPILEKIEIAAATGYGAIELWHDDIDRFLATGGTINDLKNALDDHGLEVPTTIMLKGWCEPAGDALIQGMQECRRRMEQAAAVGARHTIAGPPHGHVDLELAGQRYAELLEIGLGFGVRPSVEYLGFAETVNTIDDALSIMNASQHPEATVILDPFHDFRGGGGHESISKLRPEQIAICHFDDAPASPPPSEQRDPDRVMPGEGVINLTRFVTLLREIGYEGWISLELFRGDLWAQDPRDVARRGLEAMKSLCEQ